MKINITRVTQEKEKTASDQLGFGTLFTDHMLLMKAMHGQWGDAEIMPFGPLTLHPAAKVLHYGQELFEGLKAYRADDGRVLMFRPKDNLERMNQGALRAALPTLNVDNAFDAMMALIRLERNWVPNEEGTSLYIRPNLFGVDSRLGVSASEEVWFNVICSPSGAYYARGLEPVRIYVEDEYVRAVHGGTGFTKMGANYAASLLAGELAHSKGFDQVLWLDGVERRYIQEVGSMNIFFLFKDSLLTPKLDGSILPGITRKSIIALAESMGIAVDERKISIEELSDRAKAGELVEAFGSGTAAVVSPIGELFYKGESIGIGHGEIGELTRKLYDTLTGIQYGRLADPFGWVIEV